MSSVANYPLSTTSGLWFQEEAQAERRAARRDWLLFWLLVVPQLIVGGLCMHAGASRWVLLGAFSPILVASILNPFLGVAALFALLPMDELFVVTETTFTLAKVTAIFVVIGYLARAGRGRYSLLPTDPVTKASTAFGMLLLFSAVWSWAPLATLIWAVTPVLLMGITLIAVQLIDSRHRLEICLTALMLAGLVAGLLLTFKVVGVAEIDPGSEERVALGKANPNHTGRILALVSVAAVALLLYGRRYFIKLFTLGALPFAFVGVLMTKSKSASVCYVAAGIVATLMGLRARVVTRVLFLGLLASAMFGVFAVAAASKVIDPEKIFSRWSRLSATITTRSYIAVTGIGVWKSSVKNMVLGTGYGLFSYAYTEEAGRSIRLRGHLGMDPHNTWVKTLSETGVAGIGVLVWLTLAMLLAAWRTAPGYAFVSWGVLGILGVASLDTSLTYHKFTWYSIALVGATARVFPRVREEEAAEPLLVDYHRVRALA